MTGVVRTTLVFYRIARQFLITNRFNRMPEGLGHSIYLYGSLGCLNNGHFAREVWLKRKSPS